MWGKGTECPEGDGVPVSFAIISPNGPTRPLTPEIRLLPLLIEDDLFEPPEKDGVRGRDLDESLFKPFVRLFLKLFGGGLGASNSLEVIDESWVCVWTLLLVLTPPSNEVDLSCPKE